MGSTSSANEAWLRQLEELNWYHTFDLPGGYTTRGFFDHRKFVKQLPIPADLSGQRCLDVGAADGFFGFEMAKRGASEVVSVDLADLEQSDFRGARSADARGLAPHQGRANKCFAFVRDATGLDVTRVDGSIYNLESLGVGEFDFVFIGNLLLHLQDPIRALQAARGVTRGQLLSVEPMSIPQTLLRPRTATAEFATDHENTFWIFNKRGHRRLVEAGGFTIEDAGGPILQPLGARLPRWPDRSLLTKSFRDITTWGFTRQFGKTTGWVLAAPVPRS